MLVTLLVIAFVIIVLFQPARFELSRNAEISAPMSAGTGAIYRWSGKPRVREGRMIITESVPGELIRLQPEFFEPAAATNIAEFINMDKMIGDSSRKA